MALLKVKNLKVHYLLNSQNVQAVDDVTFELERGDTLGIIGESGCGKTTLAKALMRLLPPNGRIAGGQILFKNKDIVLISEEELRQIRLKQIAMIPQSSMNCLDPVYKISDQIKEAILAHETIGKREAKSRGLDLIDKVGVGREKWDYYPHQLSGGMKQRVAIAIALALNPELIIADEPTTALDVIVQYNIIKEILKLLERERILVYITHDVSMISEVCEKVAVMYAGKIVEYGNLQSIFSSPLHPYTLGLLSSVPNIWEQKEIFSIPGSPPELINPPKGCPFYPRCPFSENSCLDPIKMEKLKDRYVACINTEKVEEVSKDMQKVRNLFSSLQD